MDEAATGTQYYFVEIRYTSSTTDLICVVFRLYDIPTSKNKGYLQQAQMVELNCLPVVFSVDAE
jgi:hypothetical protein